MGEESTLGIKKDKLQTVPPLCLKEIYRSHNRFLSNTLDLAHLLDRPEYFNKDPETRTPLTASDLADWPNLQQRYEKLEAAFREKEKDGKIAEEDRERLHFTTVVSPLDPRRANTVGNIFHAASRFIDEGNADLDFMEKSELMDAVEFAQETLGTEGYNEFVESYSTLSEIVTRKKTPKVEAEEEIELLATEDPLTDLEIEQLLDQKSRAKRIPLTKEELEDIYDFGRRTQLIYNAIRKKIGISTIQNPIPDKNSSSSHS